METVSSTFWSQEDVTARAIESLQPKYPIPFLRHSETSGRCGRTQGPYLPSVSDICLLGSQQALAYRDEGTLGHLALLAAEGLLNGFQLTVPPPTL